MVIEQEYAYLYPLTKENILNYLPTTDCKLCGFDTCDEFADALLKGKTSSKDCSQLLGDLASLLNRVLSFPLPMIPYNIMMEQVEPECITIGNPTAEAPLLVTGNFVETVNLLKNILEWTGSRSYLLVTDTKGYSIDNAVVERTFSPPSIFRALTDSGIGNQLMNHRLIIPGLGKSQAWNIKSLTKWDVTVGPVSGLEVPLFIKTNNGS